MLALLMLSGLALSGCLAPTLPLPPPSRPEISSPDGSGEIHLRGRVRAEASVFAQNLRTDTIAGQHTGKSGQYDFALRAQVGDEILLWYSQGTAQSQGLYLTVPSEDEELPGLAGAPGQ